MTWVKVCGLRTVADLDSAATAGADAAGLVLVAGTPRALTVEQAGKLAAHSKIPTIILTLDLPPEQLLKTWRKVGAAGVQPYGEHAIESGQAASAEGAIVLQPMRVQSPVILPSTADGPLPLLDGFSPGSLGGSGKKIPKQWLPPPGGRYVLAGGLNPGNVAGMVKSFRPFGVDASSGLESSPGVKDPVLISLFVREAKKQ